MTRSRFLFQAIAPLLLASAASATPLCTAMTAQAFENLGSGGCQFGSTIFYNFTYSYSNDTSPAVPASSVTVEFSDANSNPLTPVVSFLGSWDAQADDITDLGIHYQACISGPTCGGGASSPLLIVAANATVSGSFGNQSPDTTGSGFSYAEDISPDTTGGPPVPLSINYFPASGTPFGPVSLGSGNQAFGSQQQISVSKDLELFAGDQLYTPPGPGPDDALVTQVDEGLVEVNSPEPTTLLLIGGALIGLGLAARKRKRVA